MNETTDKEDQCSSEHTTNVFPRKYPGFDSLAEHRLTKCCVVTRITQTASASHQYNADGMTEKD